MIEFLFSGFGLLTLIVMGIVLAAGIISSEMNSVWGGALTFVGLLASAHFLYDVNMISAFQNDWLSILFYALVFVAIGSVYTLFWKWPLYIREIFPRIKRYYEQWRDAEIQALERRNKPLNAGNRTFHEVLNKDLVPSAEEAKKEYPQFSLEVYMDGENYIGAARNNKEAISSMVLLWPWSFTWEITRKPLTWISQNLYRIFGDLLNKVSKRVVADMYKDTKS